MRERIAAETMAHQQRVAASTEANAVEQQQEDGAELRECTKRLIETVDEVDRYLKNVLAGESLSSR